MRIIILIVFLAIGICYGSLPTGPVQGICRITLTDNTILEGVILISRCGYLKVCDTNGFILYSSKEVKPKLFGYGFESLSINRNGQNEKVAFKYVGEHEKEYSSNKFKIYYVEDITSSIHYLTNYEFEFVTDSSISSEKTKILRRKYLSEYRLLEYIPIMKNVPDGAFITPLKLKNRFEQIPLDEISKIELIHYPSNQWLDKIEKAEKLVKPDSEGDKMYPVWFHWLINRPYRKDKYFKEWPY